MVYFNLAVNLAKYFKSTNFRNDLKENLLMDILPILVLLSPLHNSILIPMHLYLHKLLMEDQEQSLEFYNFFGWCLFFNQVKTNQNFEEIKKVQAKKLVKSNKSKLFFS